MAMDDRIRASDADRERIAARLREHYAEGRLTSEELDERVTAALSAKTLGDLRHLMADLPEPGMTQQPGGWPMTSEPRPVMVRSGPSLLPLALLFLFLAVLLPGGGWLFFGFFQFVLVFVLIVAGVAVFAAARARRRIRRHWQDHSYQGPWNGPTGHWM
jgi:Domain of unknown function (DUF1707)